MSRVILVFISALIVAFISYGIYVIQSNYRKGRIPKGGKLLVTDMKTITQLNLANYTLDHYYDPSKYRTPHMIGIIGCSNELGATYYSDHANVYALETNAKEPRLVYSGQHQWHPISMSVEYVTGKLYIGDMLEGGLTVHDLNNGISTVLVGAGLFFCRGMAIDVDQKYLFLLDQFQILRMDLDGENKKTIYETTDVLYLDAAGRSEMRGRQNIRAYLHVSGIAVDPNVQRLYWASVVNPTIISSDYDGKDDRLYFYHVTDFFRPDYTMSNTLTMMDDTLYWVLAVDPRIIRRITPELRTKAVYLMTKYPYFQIKACDGVPKYKDKRHNPCAFYNGRCEQLCFLSRNNYQGYRCGCRFGFELTENQRNCRLIQEYLVFLESRMVKALSLSESPVYVFEPPGYLATTGNTINITEMFKHDKPILGTMIDFDVEHNLMFYTDQVFNEDQNRWELKLQVRQMMEATDEPTIFSPDNIFSVHVRGFAFDWITKNLYFMSAVYENQSALLVTNIFDPTYVKVLSFNLKTANTTGQGFYGPFVHPNRGYLFMLSSEENVGTIIRTTTIGTNFTVVYTSKFGRVLSGLTIDYDQDRLYWSEMREVKPDVWHYYIVNSNLDGKDVRLFDLYKELLLPYSLSVYRNHIYGIDAGKRMFRMNKAGRNVVILAESRRFSYHVKIFSSKLQLIDSGHPCKNHKCHSFCFAVPTQSGKLKGTCDCGDGWILEKDGFTCRFDKDEFLRRIKPKHLS